MRLCLHRIGSRAFLVLRVCCCDAPGCTNLASYYSRIGALFFNTSQILSKPERTIFATDRQKIFTIEAVGARRHFLMDARKNSATGIWCKDMDGCNCQLHSQLFFV